MMGDVVVISFGLIVLVVAALVLAITFQRVAAANRRRADQRAGRFVYGAPTRVVLVAKDGTETDLTASVATITFVDR